MFYTRQTLKYELTQFCNLNIVIGFLAILQAFSHFPFLQATAQKTHSLFFVLECFHGTFLNAYSYLLQVNMKVFVLPCQFLLCNNNL